MFNNNNEHKPEEVEAKRELVKNEEIYIFINSIITNLLIIFFHFLVQFQVSEVVAKLGFDLVVTYAKVHTRQRYMFSFTLVVNVNNVSMHVSSRLNILFRIIVVVHNKSKGGLSLGSKVIRVVVYFLIKLSF